MELNVNYQDLDLFKRPVYEQTEYWDNFHVIGQIEVRKDLDPNNPFLRFAPNVSGTALIDGGDTTFNIGHYYTGLRLLEKNGYDVSNFHRSSVEAQEKSFSVLYHKKTFGVYARHPDPNMWYSDQYRMSRDQQKSVISAESLNPSKKSFFRGLAVMVKHAVQRLFLFDAKFKQNNTNDWKFPTFTGPTIWGSYIRFLISKHKAFYILYPLLLLTDIEIVVNALVKQGPEATDSDVLNHIGYSIWFHHVAPTPWTYLLNNKLNKKDHFRAKLLRYYDDGRKPWVNYVIWSKLMDIYFKE